MAGVFDDPPVLRTRCLLMRQVTETDGQGRFAIFADDQVTEHYAWDAFTSVRQGRSRSSPRVQRGKPELGEQGAVVAAG